MNHKELVEFLNNTSILQVEILLRPKISIPKESLPIIDIKSYPDSISWRQALVDRQKKITQKDKENLASKAVELGLETHSAEVLNAVAVRGSPAMILQLLSIVTIEIASFDREMKMLKN